MKFRVINGDRRNLEDRVIRNMSDGRICLEDLDKLKPWGKLYLVNKPVGSAKNRMPGDQDLFSTKRPTLDLGRH